MLTYVTVSLRAHWVECEIILYRCFWWDSRKFNSPEVDQQHSDSHERDRQCTWSLHNEASAPFGGHEVMFYPPYTDRTLISHRCRFLLGSDNMGGGSRKDAICAGTRITRAHFWGHTTVCRLPGMHECDAPAWKLSRRRNTNYNE